jgi:hypothetical protein
MLRLLKELRLPLACLAAALAVGAAAIVDHGWKQDRIDRAQVSEYFCRVYGLRCGGPDWHTIEHRWQVRQVVYEVAVGALAALGLGLGYRAVRRTTRSSWRSER